MENVWRCHDCLHVRSKRMISFAFIGHSCDSSTTQRFDGSEGALPPHHSWSNGVPSIFRVRGKGYMQDRAKVPPGKASLNQAVASAGSFWSVRYVGHSSSFNVAQSSNCCYLFLLVVDGTAVLSVPNRVKGIRCALLYPPYFTLVPPSHCYVQLSPCTIW